MTIMSTFLISGFLNLKSTWVPQKVLEQVIETIKNAYCQLCHKDPIPFLLLKKFFYIFHLLSTLSLSLQMFSSYTNIIIPSILISLYPTTTIPLRIISRKNRLSWLCPTLVSLDLAFRHPRLLHHQVSFVKVTNNFHVG